MTEHLILNDGHSLPEIGFGTYPLRGDDGYRAIRSALDAGYRLIDSARNYRNEEEVGRAIRDFLKESGTPRAEVMVQTKIPGRHHEHDAAIASGRESLAMMGLDYIDVLLIHWPNPITGKYLEAWRALVELREQGVARTIGTSNFTAGHLAAIIDDSGVTPAINQIELHPYFLNEEVRAYGEEHGIATEAWSPIAQGAVLDDPVVTRVAGRLDRTPAQVVLRWHVQRGSIVFPKSVTAERIRENIALFDFELGPQDMDIIDGLDRGESGRTGPNPDRFAYIPA